MKLFECQKCGQPIYFENTECQRCHATLGFLADSLVMTALEPLAEAGTYRPLANPQLSVRYCQNAEYAACNWLLPTHSKDTFCKACQANRTIPDLSDAQRLACWQRLEVAKHRLMYTILKLGLPHPTETEDEKARVAKIQAMGPEKIAPLCGYLASDLSADVTGQIFAVRMNEIYLMSQSRPIRSVQRSDGWTPQTIANHAMPAMKGSFFKLDRSADIFNWDPV